MFNKSGRSSSRGRPMRDDARGGRGGFGEAKRDRKDRKDRKDGFVKRAPRNQARFQFSSSEEIDYKNLNLLQKFVTDRGKIISRRISGVTAKQQRSLTIAIKIAKYLALLPTGQRGS